MSNAAPFIDLSQAPYSCVPGSDCTAAIQQAIDDTRSACITAGGNPNSAPCVFYFPGSLTSSKSAPNFYQVNKPILCDIGQIVFKGDGRQTTLIRAFHGGDCLRFGYSRDGAGVSTQALDSTYWPSNSGVLDGSQAATVGVRTKGTQVISWSGSGWGSGPSPTAPNFWGGVSQITVDLAVQINDGKGVTVCGLDSWFVNLTGEVRIFVSTPDGVSHQIHWTANTSPVGGAFTRISFQVDLNAGTANAWQDGVQLGNPVSGSSIPSGTTFLPNGTVAVSTGKFVIGVIGNDDTIYGLKVTQGLLYNVSTTGSTQTRIDSATLNDQRRYFTVESTTCGLLKLTDGQNSYRYEQATGGTGEAMYGFWWNSTLQNNFWSGNVTIKDLSIQSDFYGGALSFAHPNGIIRVTDCNITGGMRGVDNHAYFPSFTYNVSGCSITGTHDCGWLGFQQTAVFHQVDIPAYNRAALALWGTNLNYCQGFIGQPSPLPTDCVRVRNGQAGAILTFDHVLMDFEGNAPTNSYFSVDGQSASSGVQMHIRDCVGGILPGSGSDVLLNDVAGIRGPHLLFLGGLVGNIGRVASVTKTSGASSVWKVIDLSAPPGGNPRIQ